MSKAYKDRHVDTVVYTATASFDEVVIDCHLFKDANVFLYPVSCILAAMNMQDPAASTFYFAKCLKTVTRHILAGYFYYIGPFQ